MLFRSLQEPGEGADYEELKRSLFEEHFDIIHTAWTKDVFKFEGKHWKIPGKPIKWMAHEVAKKYGAGLNANNEIEEIGIAPPTYNKAIPDLFMPFATSERSIAWGMERGIVPVTIMTHPEVIKGHFEAGLRAAEKAGRKVKFGQGMAMSREIIVADTDAEAEAIAREAGS